MLLPLHLDLRVSRLGRMAGVAGLLAGFAGCGLSALPLWLCLLLAGLMIALAIPGLRRAPGAGLHLDVQGRWQEETAAGLRVDLVLRDVRLTPFGIALLFAGPGRSCGWLWLWPDSADADALRRLRVWLRWHWARQPSAG
jgi:hypothetical protein